MMVISRRRKFRILWAFLLLGVCFTVVVSEAAGPRKSRKKVALKVLLSTFSENADNYDALSLRILIKKISKQKLNYKQWSNIRSYLIQNPVVGYDYIYKWEKLRPESPAEEPEVQKINDMIDRADQLTLEENFEGAFTIYQEVALRLKKEIVGGQKENLYLYSVMLHSMGRSLFGAERFSDALEVYRWLPKNYPRLRQALFEKMWAAFRQGRLDMALGAIASQESSYFSEYLEPESYLIKTYIFKKLCREDDLKALRQGMKNLKVRIEKRDPKFFDEWASSDIELLSLSRLTRIDPEDDVSKDVSKAERTAEIKSINEILREKFEIEMTRVQRDLTNILAYSNIAMGTGDFSFIKHEEIDHTKIMERGDEVWAVDDAEDWVDEIGGHLFIGDSFCKKDQKNSGAR